jgi:hypothetical protein
MASNAFEKFRRSMSIGYMEWHEGIGYDLVALAALPPEELVEDLRALPLLTERFLRG